MKWTLDYTYVPDRYRIVDEDKNLVATTPYGDKAEQIVRDHNRAEACEAMREVVQDFVRYQNDTDYLEEHERRAFEATGGNITAKEALLEKAKAALALCKDKE